MSEAVKKSAGWGSFVCPSCRLVFRIPRDHDGYGVVCPGCKEMLAIPDDVKIHKMLEGFKTSSDDQPEIKAKLQPAAEATTHQAAMHKHMASSSSPDWERDVDPDEVPKRSNHLVLSLLYLGGVTGFVMICWALFSVVTTVELEEVVERSDEEVPLWQQMNEELEVQKPAVKETGIVAIAQDENWRSDVVGAKVGEVARHIFEAESVEEWEPYLYDAENVMPKVRAYYAENPWKPVKLSEQFGSGALTVIPPLVKVSGELADYSIIHLLFERVGDKFLFDWEYWVGWSEMPWQEFKDEKPSEPKVFRAVCYYDNYYAYGFRDDKKWQVYRLESIDSEHVLYGYIDQTTNMGLIGAVAPHSDGSRITIKVHYPEDARARNQVLIDELVMPDWYDVERIQVPVEEEK
ncbi:hypothetical protein [Persicirhabdus sediminis]|uniref:Uncharacterized protein n=1 Tax=Persicirhabdus sediminis TaxID=454144 RepID=A0A8J7MHS6_9BACT|nr:hypothetical protein [Persicirhabdus sediminis]MBK1791608.1 hypothetical protein [Persicirhabdus sediminis]